MMAARIAQIIFVTGDARAAVQARRALGARITAIETPEQLREAAGRERGALIALDGRTVDVELVLRTTPELEGCGIIVWRNGAPIVDRHMPGGGCTRVLATTEAPLATVLELLARITSASADSRPRRAPRR